MASAVTNIHNGGTTSAKKKEDPTTNNSLPIPVNFYTGESATQELDNRTITALPSNKTSTSLTTSDKVIIFGICILAVAGLLSLFSGLPAALVFLLFILFVLVVGRV